MKLSDIRRVLILGAGTMGQQIGFTCAMHGYTVVMYDISQEILDKSISRMQKLGSWFVSTGRIAPEQLGEIMARISGTSDPALAARDADFISESVPEDPAVKARVFNQFNELCPERTIFTTNTSMLVPSMIADKTGRPEKFAALHFHDVRTSSVVDVMPHPGTAPEVTELVREFARSIGQIVITLNRENNGYVFNTMLSSLFFSSLSLASKGWLLSRTSTVRGWASCTPRSDPSASWTRSGSPRSIPLPITGPGRPAIHRPWRMRLF